MACNIESGLVRKEADGKWGFIYSHLAPELSGAVKLWGRHVPCPHPHHKDSTDAFRLFDRDGGKLGGGVCNTCGGFRDGLGLLQWLKGWNFPETVEAVAGVLGIIQGQPMPKPRQRSAEEIREEEARQRAEEEKRRQEDVALRTRLNQLFHVEGAFLDAPESEPVRTYLRSRGLWNPAWGKMKCLKCHPGLVYKNKLREWVGKFPGLMATIVDQYGLPVTFHRIFVTPDGQKAPVDEPKKTMTVPHDRDINGCAVRLGRAGRVLGVAEGIETAMAATLGTGMPVWACLNATLLETFIPPEGVEEVVIWADKDRSGRGQQAAQTLQLRLWEKNIRSRVWLPEMRIPPDAKGVDWNDVWLAKRRAGFPELTDRAAVA